MQDYKFSLSLPLSLFYPLNLNLIREKNTVSKLWPIPHYPAVKRLGKPRARLMAASHFIFPPGNSSVSQIHLKTLQPIPSNLGILTFFFLLLLLFLKLAA